MKVGELIALLGLLDQDALVVLASDAEGNGYGELEPDGIEAGKGVVEEREINVLHPDDYESYDDLKNVVTFYPS
jgi:hypothetical protein